MTAIATDLTRSTPSADYRCAHCDLHVPQAMVEDQAAEQFCCEGCRVAKESILACGLADYYARRDATPQPVLHKHASFLELDDVAFTSQHVTTDATGRRSADLCLEGAHCAACVWLLERLPTLHPGLLTLELNMGRGVAHVTWDPAQTKLSAIASRLARFGYQPHPVEPSALNNSRIAHDRRSLVRIGIAAACAGNVMLLAFALYSGAVEQPYATMFRWLSAAIALVSVAGPGRVFFLGAWGALRTRSWHLDTPVAMAIGVGAVAGTVNTVRGSGEIYFDSITMLILLLLIGRWLQQRQQHRATDAVELLFSMTPRRVQKVVQDASGDQIEDAAIDSVCIGDLLAISPQGTVPVDGVVESGTAHLDESVLTGEPYPRRSDIGDRVTAGAVNTGGGFRVRVTATGRATRVGKMMATIESLSRSRVPLIGSADVIAKPFVIATLLLSALCFSMHVANGFEHAAQLTVAMMIAICPCAIALAAPLSSSISVGRLARHGTMVKGGDVLEALSKPATLVIDKTGTLTNGTFSLLEWHGDSSLRPIAAALEQDSPHPIARAFKGDTAETTDDVTSIEHRLGLGVIGQWKNNPVGVGSSRLVAELEASCPESLRARADEAEARGHAAVFVVVEREVRAVAILGDELRVDARSAIDTLKTKGWHPVLLSGDSEQRTARIANELGICEHRSVASPDDKLAFVKQRMLNGPVVMVGDGVNDSTALAASTVGIAVAGGAEASLTAADVYLSRPDLKPLLDLLSSARSATRRVRACLIAGGSYNLVAASLALTGIMSPVLAAILMPISSLTVLAIALGRDNSHQGTGE